MMTNKQKNAVYVISTFVVSIVILIFSMLTTKDIPYLGVLTLVLFAIITESLSVVMGERTLSVTSAITICALISYGPFAAITTSFISGLLCVKRQPNTNKTYHLFNRRIFSTLSNSSMSILSSAASSYVYIAFHGKILNSNILGASPSVHEVFTQISSQALFIIIAIFVEMLVNTLLFAGYLHTTGKGQLLREWIFEFFWSFAGLLVVGLLGVLLTGFYISYDWFVVMIFFAPLFLARHTFSLYNNLRISYMDTVKSLSDAIEEKDSYTRGHSMRVQEYSALIADELHYSPKQKEVLQYAALLHDVGKIGVQEQILNKVGKLDSIEWDSMRQHPEKGARIISSVKYLKDCVPMIKYHHKYYDGSGYPELSPDEKVPFESYILCVADAYDAMTSRRKYREPFTKDQALAEIERCVGTQFEPTVAKAFISAISKHPVNAFETTYSFENNNHPEAVSQ